MPPVLSRRCVLVLVLATWTAFATALMAWGSIELLPSDVPNASVRTTAPVVGSSAQAWMVAPLFWSVALLGLSAWGVGTSAYGRRRASDISWPWRVLLMVLAGRVLCWLVQGVLSWWQLPLLVQVSQTSVGVFLFLGLMADRVDTRWGQPVVVLTGGVLVVLATLWYLFTNYFWQQADARALLMLQILPLLLLPSGLLNLPVRLLRNREIRFMVLAYALTLIASWSLLPATGSALRWVDALYQALPWGSLLALCLLLLSPVVRARRAQGQRTARGAHQSAD